jgi:glutathione S-transferase
MKLYTYDPAPNPRRVQLFIEYKGIDIETTQIDLGANQQFDKTFLSINPLATVPTLELDDGSVLTEIISICDYIESTYPDKPLLGNSPAQRAQILNWDHRLHGEFLLAIAEVLRNTSKMFTDRPITGQAKFAQIPELAERGQGRINMIFNELELYFGKHQYLVGDSLSLADIDAYACFEFCAWIKKAIPDSSSNTKTWLERAKKELGQ